MSNEQLKYKITLLGDTAVGKTSLFKKLTSDDFDPKKAISTIGIDKRSLNMTINTDDGIKEVDISLYDTAGQERFRSIAITYFRESSGLLVMYDITKEETFQSIEHWITDIKNNLGSNAKYLIIVLGNKLDKIEQEGRQVQENDAKEFCKNNEIFFGGECSVIDFSPEKLTEMFKKYIEEVYKKVGGGVKNRSNSVLQRPEKGKKKKGCC